MQDILKRYPGACAFGSCLGVGQKDKVLLLTDRATCEPAINIIQQALMRCTQYVDVCNGLPLRLAEDFPARLRSILLKSDIILLCAHQSWYQAPLRRKLKYIFAKRIVECYNVNLKMLAKGGLCAQYQRVAKLTDKCATAFLPGQEIRITSSAGTDFSAIIKNVSTETGIYSRQASGGNLPAGEVSLGLVETSGSGEIVIDSSMDVAGIIKKGELSLRIRRGCIERAWGRKSNLIKALLKRENTAYCAVEVGIGTNQWSLDGISVLEDEKKFSNVHFGFGNNTYFSGSIKGGHYDAVIRRPKIFCDGQQLKLKEFIEGK